jgi:hypothetical protein
LEDELIHNNIQRVNNENEAAYTIKLKEDWNKQLNGVTKHSHQLKKEMRDFVETVIL